MSGLLQDANWGTVPDWALVAGSVVVAVFAIRAYLAQRQQVDLLREDYETQHAGRVLVWAKSTSRPMKMQGVEEEDEDAVRAVIVVKLVLHNGGDEPVYDLDVSVTLPGYSVEKYGKDLLPPDRQRREPLVHLKTTSAEVAQATYKPAAVDIEFTWRDSRSRRWCRTKDGHLERLVD